MDKKIFSLLCRTQFNIFCWELSVDKYKRYDKIISIFSAIVSSSSIATWAIWKHLDWLWAIIIAASQVLTILKPYFPYFKYATELNNKKHELKALNTNVAELWNKIQNKRISEKEASEAYFGFKKQIITIEDFETDFTPDKKTKEKAKEELNKFLKNEKLN